MSAGRVVLVGGAGFVGRSLARQLLQKTDHTVQLVSRHPEASLQRHPIADVEPAALDRLRTAAVDIRDPDSLARVCEGATAVVNLVGILDEERQKVNGNRFDTVQHRGAAAVARLTHATGARLVHVSAIGANASSDIGYIRSKGLGEQAILREDPTATILRPSLIFGPGDDFFNRLARLAHLLPVMPVFGGGQTRYQPVYVEDVARAIRYCLAAGDLRQLSPTATLEDTRGRILELGGPTVYTYRQMVEACMTAAQLTWQRPMLSLPWWMANLQGSVMEHLPISGIFSLTRDQALMLQLDNVVADGALGLWDLGIQPTSGKDIWPSYLDKRKS